MSLPSYENNNSNDSSSSSGEEGNNDTIVVRARQRQIMGLLDSDSKKERDMVLLSKDPVLRSWAEGNLRRACRYCKANVPGEDSERYHPMKEHLQTCDSYQNLMRRKREGDQAFSALTHLSQDIDFLAMRKREIEFSIKRNVADILEILAQYGEAGSFVSTSEDEYNSRWDYGRANARKVGVTNMFGSSRLPDKWEVKDWSYAKEDGLTSIHEPHHITREVDDALQKLRIKHRELFSNIIDRDLQRLAVSIGVVGAK
jgi:hypothetical protein